MSVPPTKEYDVCIVGAGMVGSAAARHLMLHLQQESPNTRVCVIGPESNRGTPARGAHYDVARITRRLDGTSKAWATLADKSLAAHPSLERQSGIKFHDPCGLLWVSQSSTDPTVRMLRENIRFINDTTALKQPWVEELTGEQAISKTYPFLSFQHLQNYNANEILGFHEIPGLGGGTVDPRLLVTAELLVAERLGADIVRDAVLRVVPAPSATSSTFYDVYGEHTHVRCKKVIVAAGAFTSFFELSPKPVSYCLINETVVLIRVHTDDAAQVKNAPSIINTAGGARQRYYMLPPREYAEYGPGLWIKAGPITDDFTAILATHKQALDWVDKKEHDLEAEKYIEACIRETYARIRLDPGRRVVHCVFDHTPNASPFIGCLDGNNWHMFVGGNGRAAKSCDEIGRLLALSAWTGQWPQDASISKDECTLEFLPEAIKTMEQLNQFMNLNGSRYQQLEKPQRAHL